MNRLWSAVGGLVLVVVAAASCGGTPSGLATGSTAGTGAPRSTTTTALPTPVMTTTRPADTGSLTVTVTVSPANAAAGTPVTFTVEIRGPGTLDSEDIHFGDGATQGANAGMVACGDTARADSTASHPHSYAAPGTYRFTDEVQVIGPPPACSREDVTGSATVTVAEP